MNLNFEVSGDNVLETRAALESKGIAVFVVNTPEEAKSQLLKLIPQELRLARAPQ